MAAKSKKPDKKKPEDDPGNPGEVTLEPAGQVVVTPQAVPPKPAEPKTIHERRFPPPIPEAKPED